MFCCQGWSKPVLFRARILRPVGRRPLPWQFLWFRSIRASSCTAVLEPFGSFFAISLPESLRLPVAHLQHLRSVYQSQRPALHSRQHLCSSQFPRTHRCPLQPDLLRRSQCRGHFYWGLKGTLSKRFNTTGLSWRAVGSPKNIRIPTYLQSGPLCSSVSRKACRAPTKATDRCSLTI